MQRSATNNEIRKKLKKFFFSVGIIIYNGYGLYN